MRICIVRLSSLGDIVMCLPMIRTIQKSFPAAEISWVIGDSFYPLLEKLDGINFIPLPKIKSFKEFLFAKKILKSYRFDILLAMQASFSAHLIYSLINAKRKIGYDRFRSRDFHGLFVNERIPFFKEHTVEGFVRFATTIGAREVSFDGGIPLGLKEVEWAKQFQSPYFVINPCSSKREKNWSFGNYLPIIEYVINKYGLMAVVTGGSLDKAGCDQIANASGCLNLCGKTSLRELAALLKGSKFLLAPDTGPAHIASALGTPVIGLFAPTSSLLTGPYFSKDQVVDKHSEVLDRLASTKEKKLGWNVRIYHKEAMDLISIDDVIQKIETLNLK